MSLVTSIYSDPVKGTIASTTMSPPVSDDELATFESSVDWGKIFGAAAGAAVGAYIGHAVLRGQRRRDMVIGGIVGAVVGYYVGGLVAAEV